MSTASAPGCRAHVRFSPDHAAITAELTAHLEDHAAALEARGLSPEEAAAQAVTAMGEPEELGRQLDRAHPPLLCLSVAATNIILVFLLVVCILALALWSLDSAKTVLARRAAPEDTRRTTRAIRIPAGYRRVGRGGRPAAPLPHHRCHELGPGNRSPMRST